MGVAAELPGQHLAVKGRDEQDRRLRLDGPVRLGEVTRLDVEAAGAQRAALEAQRGDIDAAYTWLPTLDQLRTTGKVRRGTVGAIFGSLTFPTKLSVDDLMADIAVIFHWPPSELYPMSLTELTTWREKAIQRSGHTNE